uniref:Uncharacterized protein n=1 Tax=Arundo donax TaxID=35708 RepID=A0A0A9GI44_ARUDO
MLQTFLLLGLLLTHAGLKQNLIWKSQPKT